MPWPKGVKRPEETKKKIAITNRRLALEDGRRFPSRKGTKHSEETKRKIGLAHKRLGTIPPNRKGIPMSDEAKQKISKSRKGKKFSAEWRQNMADARRGEKSHFWKGGITPEHRKIRNSREYASWRTAVFERDNYTCVLCGIKGGWSKEQKRKINLNADHIKRFALYPELRLDISNGRTLCLECHQQTDTFGRLRK